MCEPIHDDSDRCDLQLGSWTSVSQLVVVSFAGEDQRRRLSMILESSPDLLEKNPKFNQLDDYYQL